VVGVASKLTAKQQRFVQEYLVDYNATRAAIQAGYSAKYAGQNADKLLKNTNVAAELRRLGQKTAEKLDISREWLMQELRYVAAARLPDFSSIVTEPVQKMAIHPLTGEVINVPSGYTQTVRFTDTKDLPDDKAAALAGIKQTAHGIDIKLHDKVRALELLGKAVGLFDGNAAPPAQENNLFDAIVGTVEEDIDTDDLPEFEQEATAGNDVVETPGVQKP